MTQEQKDKLEQTAQRKWEEDQATNPTPVNPHAYVYGFKAGAQTILDNPSEWGLTTTGNHEKMMLGYEKTILELEAQLSRYREALESIINESEQLYPDRFIDVAVGIAKEALKQQDDDQRKNS